MNNATKERTELPFWLARFYRCQAHHFPDNYWVRTMSNNTRCMLQASVHLGCGDGGVRWNCIKPLSMMFKISPAVIMNLDNLCKTLERIKINIKSSAETKGKRYRGGFRFRTRLLCVVVVVVLMGRYHMRLGSPERYFTFQTKAIILMIMDFLPLLLPSSAAFAPALRIVPLRWLKNNWIPAMNPASDSIVMIIYRRHCFWFRIVQYQLTWGKWKGYRSSARVCKWQDPENLRD